jgi:DNA (cytosine-5)-methyltransferase 1
VNLPADYLPRLLLSHGPRRPAGHTHFIVNLPNAQPDVPPIPCPAKAPESGPIPVVSFFTGAGGLDLGFHQEGFKTVLALDSNESAVATFNANHAGQPAHARDLSKLTARELTALIRKQAPGVRPRGVIGGPPCQTFSIGNVRKHRHDRRGALGYHYARLLGTLNRVYELDFFIFENVTGMLKPKHRRQYRRIISDLTAAGFSVSVGQLNASAFGVPQHRHRIIIAGINSRKFPGVNFAFPAGTCTVLRTVRQTISHLGEPAYFVRGMTSKDVPFHANHWTMMPKSEKFRATPPESEDGRSFRRLKWDEPSRTVAYGNREVHLHPCGHRRLSVLEAMLLQGFPPDYTLHGTLSDQITQVSNAVPPPLAAALAAAMKAQLYQPPVLAASLPERGAKTDRAEAGATVRVA